ncbi:MAG TPA: phage tail protein [Solirubrobacteraceae bacterium]
MSDSYVCTSIFGQRLEERLEPWMSPDLARYVDAIGVMYQPILELAEEEGSDGEPGWVPAWGRIMDPTLCPPKALRWLAQFVGTELPITASTEESRKLIKEHQGFQRGTLPAIEAAIRRVLGAAPFTVKERTNAAGEEKAYWFVVIVGTGKSSTALKEAIEAVKPGGVQFTVIEATNDWINGVKAHWTEVTVPATWAAMVEPNY